jgi:hypothetical protein
VISGPSVSAQTSLGQATEVTAPSNAGGVPPDVVFFGVSCTSTGNCVAVGSYIDTSNVTQAMEATETGGTWGQATEETAPSNAASDPDAVFFGVSCTSAGNCVAVGSYIDTSNITQAMEATETGGTWGQATEVTASSNSGAEFFGVSCTSAGNCVAVGSSAVEATETGGTWGQATEVTLPSNAESGSPNALSGVSCTSAGNCVAVGYYIDSSGGYQAMEATETGGAWGQATEVTAPSNANSISTCFFGLYQFCVPRALNGVSCTSAGNCVAVGNYDSSGVEQAMEATETGGTWGQAAEVTLPATARVGLPPGAALNGVSCTSAGNCVAVGNYGDSSGETQAMEATETGGTWEQASEETLPSNGSSTGQIAMLRGVSCTSARNCVAVGNYLGTSPSGGTEAMAATISHINCGDSVSGCNLSGANLEGIDLAGVNASGANLDRASLTGADLAETNLTGANLNLADLSGSDLSGANLTGANLNRANLTGANLSTAVLTGANLNGVTWSATTCPDGTNSAADGGTCLGHL